MLLLLCLGFLCVSWLKTGVSTVRWVDVLSLTPAWKSERESLKPSRSTAKTTFDGGHSRGELTSEKTVEL